MTMTIQLAPLPLRVFPSAPAESPNATRAPLDAYLARLGSPESRRVMLSSLNTIACAVSGGTRDARSFPWAILRYPQTAAIRGWLNDRTSPATASRDLCTLRGILRECWRLGLLAGDDYRRAVDLAPIRGRRPAPRPGTGRR